MKSFDLKMSWNDYKQGLNKRKTENPNGFETWKNNLNMVLQTLLKQYMKKNQQKTKTKNQEMF